MNINKMKYEYFVDNMVISLKKITKKCKNVKNHGQYFRYV